MRMNMFRFICSSATTLGYHLLLVAASAAVEWRRPQLNRRIVSRIAVATAGFTAFWCQFGLMMNWLMD
jgi:hypothetical protein